MLLTAGGPGAGNHAFGAFVGLPVLNLELAYAYGITERLTYELELSIPATPVALGYNSTALRFTATRAGGFALALRGGASRSPTPTTRTPTGGARRSASAAASNARGPGFAS